MMERSSRPNRAPARRYLCVAILAVVAIAVAACGGPSPSGSPTSNPTPGATQVANATPLPSPTAQANVPAASPATIGRISSSGAVASLLADGSLAIVDASGHAFGL